MASSDIGKRVDYRLFAYLGILLVIGLFMLTSASSPLGYARFEDKYFFIKRQLLFGLLPGLVLFFFFVKVQYQTLKKLSPFVFIASLITLVLVFIPGIGSTLGTGTHSWLIIAGSSFQPAEFAKLGLILYFAWYLHKQGKTIKDLKEGFIPALIVGLVPVVLVVLQPDIGTVAILFAIVFGMLFLAEAKWIHIGGLAGLGAVVLVIMIMIAPYRVARLTTFLHPELDPQGIGYQINQASLAIGSGGFWGVGFGHSRQKFQYLPEVHADSIFAVIAEEMGFWFVVLFLALLLAIARRAFLSARYAPDSFGKYVIGGIIIWFLTQSFMNIGAIVGIMPLTGVPLPFVSHGGTALAIAMGAAGILVSMSKESS